MKLPGCWFPLASLFVTGSARAQSTSSMGDQILRNALGEMFGFERAAAISPEPAKEVARIAQAFGQEDDITVLVIKPTAKFEAVPA